MHNWNEVFEKNGYRPVGRQVRTTGEVTRLRALLTAAAHPEMWPAENAGRVVDDLITAARHEYGDAIAKTIETVTADLLAHQPCYRLNCCDCAQRYVVEKLVRVARYGDGVHEHLDSGDPE